MSLELYDTHAHLDFPDFQTELPAILARARKAQVTRMITIGTDASRSRRCLEIAAQNEDVHAVVGWHPGNVLEAPADWRPELRELCSQSRVTAIGETGMDYYRLPSTQGLGDAGTDAHYKKRQAELFEQHLEVAAATGFNVVIHQRAAWADTMAILKPYQGRLKAVFHCFSESLPSLHQVLDLGFMVSFTGILTFKNGEGVRAALAATPPESFMLETDCPYLAPIPYRGKRCEPAYVVETAKVAAQVRNMDLNDLAVLTSQNARRFFRGLGD